MPDYKRHYTYLAGEIDKALTLLEAEERVMREMESTQIQKIR